MSLLNCKAVCFDDIRVIFCLNGFYIDEEFQVMEIGFWSRKITGSIPFFSNKNYSKLKSKEKISVNFLTNSHHGIEFNNKFDKGFSQADVVSCIKYIYHVCSDDVKSRYYIGYINDRFLLNFVGKSGLGYMLVNIDQMYNAPAPSNEEMLGSENYGKDDYKPCNLHKKLENNLEPHCVKVKAEFLADFCKKMETENKKALKEMLIN